MKSCTTINLRKNKIAIKINEESDQESILYSLRKKIPELKKLYKDDKTPIIITGKILKNKEIEEIQELIKKYLDVEIEFDSPRTLGLYGITKAYNKEIATSDTKFHRGSLRSGQKIEYEGSYVVLGDVNDGAEVIAGDHIIVLGTLRGLAHAGAKGNREAIIAASSIEAPQLRIADVIKERERQVLNERFIIGKTQMELASELGISQAQISRIEKNSIAKIKKLIK